MGCYVEKERRGGPPELASYQAVTALTNRYLVGCLEGYDTGPLRSARCFVKIPFIFYIYFLRL